VRNHLTLLVCLSFFVLGASSARAESREALAESLFREGKQLFEAGRYDEACPKLAESHRVDPRTGTLLANAICHEKQGKLATAWSEYASVAARAKRERNDARERHARDKAAQLEAVLSTLTLALASDLAGTPGLVIELDGTELGAASLGTAIPLDGGTHVVRMRSADAAPQELQVELAASEDRRVVTLHPPAAGAPVATAPAASPRETAATERSSRTLLRTGVALTAIGAAALVLSAGFGIRARRKYDASNEGCEKNGPDCFDAAALAARNAAVDAARITNYAALAGGVVLAGGAVTWLLAARRGRRAERGPTVWLAPTVTTRAAALAVGRAF